MISRQALFGSPVQYQGRISPDGTKVSWLALRDGALNLFVADTDGKTKPIQHTFGSDAVEIHRWTPNSAYILYVRAFADTETTRVFSLDVQTGAVRDLAPVNEGDFVWLEGVSKNWPNFALVRLRRAGERLFDLYRINLESGEKTLVAKNPGFAYWVNDLDITPRLGIKNGADNNQTWMVLGQNGEQVPLLSIKAANVSRTRPQQMDATSTALYLIDGRQGPFSSLTRLDLQTGDRDVLATGIDGDIEQTLFHPVTAEPLAYFTNGPLPRWRALSLGFQPVLDRLEDTLGPRFFILAATNTAEQLVVYSDRPEHPGVYSLFDLQTDTITTLFETMPTLASRSLATSGVIKTRARDGFELITYFTRAQVDEPKIAPLIVLPQPGLNSRVYYGFDPRIQWLSNRGYNVLEVNTRGASGLGRAYLQAGFGKGALLARYDLADAVQAVLAKGLADKTRVAGFGWEFGGRTVLNAAANENTPLRCAVVIDPVIDIAQIINRSEQKGSSLWLSRWQSGDGKGPDADLVYAASPLTHAQNITAASLILHSNANALLDVDKARKFTKKVRLADGKAAMVYFSEIDKAVFGGPGFIPFAALTEAFLADCLDGLAQPVGNVLDELTYEVNAGPDGVPGVPQR